MYAARETIESIVIAFVLAFLFRTFEAEAFVIPTGSMSPSLQGQHKDVCCSECGYRFRTTASSEGEDRQRLIAQRRSQQDIRSVDVVAGQCPMCRQTMVMRPDLPSGAPSYINTKDIAQQTSYPGDRILVNKYAYNHRDPDRWDVVVFKFPGNGEMNYIKRLVGLPNETLRIYQGDIFIRGDEPGSRFQIERKPAEKVHAMLQAVHDTDYDPSTLYDAGWPLRWEPTSPLGWHLDVKAGKPSVKQQFQIESNENEESQVSWLRYRNYVPQQGDWLVARNFKETGEFTGISKEQWQREAKPELIRDYNPYNAMRLRGQVLRGDWALPDDRYHLNWVGDLAVECHVQVEQAEGELLLDLVEAGQHFTCRIDLHTGQAKIDVEGFEAYTAEAKTTVNSAGSYRLLFANVDDQLLLWVNGDLVSLSSANPALQYDTEEIFGDRKNAIPTTSEADLGDLAPAGIGASGTTLTVNRLRVLRDIYYIATNSVSQLSDYPDFKLPTTQLGDNKRIPGLQSLRQLFTEPAAWPRFARRKHVDFDINESQLFVMGDNSPASQDCRLWAAPNRDGSKPGGSYLDRRLLIGKAVCVFWPHSWGGIPGASKLPGFPNFGDMRLVR